MRTKAMALLSRMWKAISAKRTAWGWIFALVSAVLYVSDKWDSLNSFYEKLKKMGPFFKFVSDAAQAPVVQLSIFLLGVTWIGIAAVISARKTGKFSAVNFGDLITFSPDRPDEIQIYRHNPPLSPKKPGSRIGVSCDKDI